jgi:hypothetical protein
MVEIKWQILIWRQKDVWHIGIDFVPHQKPKYGPKIRAFAVPTLPSKTTERLNTAQSRLQYSQSRVSFIIGGMTLLKYELFDAHTFIAVPCEKYSAASKLL